MDKLIKTICGLFFILCLSSKSYAGPEGMSNYPWELQQMPIWCGPLDDVNKALEKEGYIAMEISFGRMAALPDGQIVYAIMTYASSDVEGHILRTMETPAQQEKCVLNMLFNYKVVTPKKLTN
jgi:hypothetical protein